MGLHAFHMIQKLDLVGVLLVHVLNHLFISHFAPS